MEWTLSIYEMKLLESEVKLWVVNGQISSLRKRRKMQIIAEYMRNLVLKSMQLQNRVNLTHILTKNYVSLLKERKLIMYHVISLTVPLKKQKVAAMNNTKNYAMKVSDQMAQWSSWTL